MSSLLIDAMKMRRIAIELELAIRRRIDNRINDGKALDQLVQRHGTPVVGIIAKVGQRLLSMPREEDPPVVPPLRLLPRSEGRHRILVEQVLRDHAAHDPPRARLRLL